MRYHYITEGTCSSDIFFDIEGETITNVEFAGGCDGNLKAIPILVDGMTASEIARKCAGITCGRKSTSCADQLAAAVMQAKREASSL